MEIWKDIIGYKGLYQISNTGLVKSLDRFIENTSIVGNKCLHKRKGFTMKLSFDSDNYLVISLSKNGKRKLFKVHRLVAIAFIPNPENKPQVNHKDGDKSNNNDWNLEWNTPLENKTHAAINNLTTKGIRHNKAKLTEEDVLFIRNLRTENNISTDELVKMFKVSESTVNKIIRRAAWTHI